MKIGILTLTPAENYGGILQAASLVYALRELGHETVVINKVHWFPLWKRCARSILDKIPFQDFRGIRGSAIKKKQLREFVVNKIPISPEIVYSPHDLDNLVKKENFDAVIVGSDQVWRYEYIDDGFYTVYFLDFIKKHPIKKVSYAASFGRNEWYRSDKQQEIARLLGDFDAISVRERSGVDLCAKLFGVSAACHLDPTLLAGKKFHEQLILEDSESETFEGGLVVYGLDESEAIEKIIIKVMLELERRRGANKITFLSKSRKGRYYSVSEWLGALKNADFIITDSFHGMIFAVLFSKQFIVFGNEKRGLARFTDFLNEVGLQDRLAAEETEVMTLLEKRIDYIAVQDRIEYWRAQSLSYLRSALYDA